MNFVVRAGQREMGQHEPAGSLLLSAFSAQAFKTMHTEQIEFLRLARMMRKCSENFIPENFYERRNDLLPEGCLDKIMGGNEKFLQKLEESYDRLSVNGLFPLERLLVFSRILERAQDHLGHGQAFYAEWKQARDQKAAASQPEHKAV